MLLTHFTHDTGLTAGLNLFSVFLQYVRILCWDPVRCSTDFCGRHSRLVIQLSKKPMSLRRCGCIYHAGLRKHRESCDSYTRFDAVRALLRGSLCSFLFVFPRVTAFHHPLMFTCRGWGWSWRSTQTLFIEIYVGLISLHFLLKWTEAGRDTHWILWSFSFILIFIRTRMIQQCPRW